MYDLYIWVVTNWKALAATADPPIPENLLPDVIPALEKLEGAFRVLEEAIPPETLPWNGPEASDSEDAS